MPEIGLFSQIETKIFSLLKSALAVFNEGDGGLASWGKRGLRWASED